MTQPTFPFPLPSLVTNANLKNIPPTTLPKFYSLATEDPDTFLFEFDILCHSFDYNIDAYKIKLFPATLKESALRWFMGLGANAAGTWDEMQTLFLEKYKEYYKASCSRGDDIFKISQKEEETLENYVLCFSYTLLKNPQHVLSKDSQKLVFLRGVHDNCIEALDLMAGGDVYQSS